MTSTAAAAGLAAMASANSHFVKTAAGVKMPKMIYGTAWKKERTADLVERAVSTGFRGIDTACQPKHYQEELVGEALVRLQDTVQREDIFLQTKFTSTDGQDPTRIPYDPRAPLEEQVRQSFSRSLQNLRTDYIDSLVMHSPMPTHQQSMRVWRVFEDLARSGSVRQLGISNIYDPAALRRLYNDASIKPAVVQNRFYSRTLHDRDIRRFCRQNGIIYQSFWTLTGNPEFLESRPVLELARKRGGTPEQVLYKFVMQLGIVPLNGTTNPAHMKADLEVLDWPDFSTEELQGIGRLIGEEVPTPAP